jgi:hypothetical protein
MATTVTAADLTVTITESYNLNGVPYGNTTTKTYTSNGQVSQRIMSVAGKGAEDITWTDILGLSTLDGQGQVVKADYKYFRITNLDDTNELRLRVYNGADYVVFEVGVGNSLLLMNAGIDATTASGAVTFADIQKISGQTNTASDAIDVEFVMVTT